MCGNDGGCLLCFTPAGVLDRQIELPMAKPSMCSFGGAGSVLLRRRPGVRGVAETLRRG